MLPLSFLYCCPPLPLPVFLSEGNQHPRHREQFSQVLAHGNLSLGTRNRRGGCQDGPVGEGVRSPSTLLDPGREQSSVSLTTNGLAAISHTVNHPPCRAPCGSFITFCALRDNDVVLIFFQTSLKRSHCLPLFTSTLKTNTKHKTKNQSVSNSHELSL